MYKRQLLLHQYYSLALKLCYLKHRSWEKLNNKKNISNLKEITLTTNGSQLVKFAKRQRLPDLSTRVINDQVLERNVSDAISLRKRQDDSFDAAIELSQPIYSGGTINAQIRKSITDKNLSDVERENALSILILDANRIYLNAVKSYTMFNHADKIVEEIQPYLNKVKERVNLGISDPIELALFSIKYMTCFPDSYAYLSLSS